MIITYDAYLMQQLVLACQTANDEIVKAQQLITSVKSHADWTCKEKSVIDELMEEFKKLINRMQDDENNFLTVLKDVENELDTAENSISSLFQGVESILAKVLAIPVGVVSTVGTGLLGGAGNALGNMFGNMGDTVNDWLSNINSETAGTGGWVSSSWDKIKELFDDIGSEIQDDNQIWHGPGGISNIIDSTVDWMDGIGVVVDQPIAPNIIGNDLDNIAIPIGDLPTETEIKARIWADEIRDTMDGFIEDVFGGESSSTNSFFDTVHNTVQNTVDKINDVINPSPVIHWPHWEPINEGTPWEVIPRAIPICRMSDIQL